MWADPYDEFADKGGFDVSGYENSPSTPTVDSKSSKRASSLFPVAIKQILESTEEAMQVAGYPVSMMTVIGIIKSVEVSSTKIVYTIQDWSGTIIGMLWLETEGGAGDNQNSRVIENTYCRMTGTKRMHDGKPCLFVYNVVPVENLMELTHHYLQVLQIPLKAEEMRSFNDERMNNVSHSNAGNSSTNTSTNFPSNDGVSLPPHQMRVYRALKNCQNETGLDKHHIHEALQKQMSLVEIEKTLDFLVTEGHAYTTIDDDHFKVTDF